MADKHEFLSDGWFDAASKLIAEHAAEAPPGQNLVMNLEVTDGDRTTAVPHGRERRRHAVREGSHRRSRPHALDRHRHRREVFVANNPQAGMQAFMSGKVRIQGDMTKLMMAQAGGQGGNPALSEALQSITA